MTRNWQEVFQHGGDLERTVIDYLAALERDVTTALAGGSTQPANGGDLVATFTQPGSLTVGTGTSRFLMPIAGTIVGVIAAVGTGPTGTAILVDVNKNGTTAFTTQANRPSIAVGSNAGGLTVPDVSTFSIGDYLTIDVDQVGSGTAGADLTVQVVYAFS